MYVYHLEREKKSVHGNTSDPGLSLHEYLSHSGDSYCWREKEAYGLFHATTFSSFHAQNANFFNTVERPPATTPP